jgi:hypothetical protein
MKGEALIVHIPNLPRTNMFKHGLNLVPWKKIYGGSVHHTIGNLKTQNQQKILEKNNSSTTSIFKNTIYNCRSYCK